MSSKIAAPAAAAAPAVASKSRTSPSRGSPKGKAKKEITVTAPVPVVAEVPKTVEEAEEAPRVLTEEEKEYLGSLLAEESRLRISGPKGLSYYLNRPVQDGGVPIPEGFVYTAGLTQRLQDLFRLTATVSKSGRDTVDFTDPATGQKVTKTKAEVRQMQRDVIREIKSLPQMLSSGLVTMERTEKQRRVEERVQNKVHSGKGLFSLRKEIVEVLRGNVGKVAVVDKTVAKKTRTGIHDVSQYRFTEVNLDSSLQLFAKKESLPNTRQAIHMILMRYLQQQNVQMKVSKGGDRQETFSMPAAFVTAFGKIAGKDAGVDPSKLTFGDIQKMINSIIVPSNQALTPVQSEQVIADLSAIRMAKAAHDSLKEQQRAAAAAK